MKTLKNAILISAALLGGAGYHNSLQAAQITSHPRLWMTQADLPRLRSWAIPANPMYAQGLLPTVQAAIKVYNTLFFPGGNPNPNWPDSGIITWPTYPSESYAELFAFMSQVDPNPNARIQHAKRARNLLMYAINEAAKGPLTGAPFRDPQFATFDRSRMYGEGFPLTVDWIYNAVDSNGDLILTAQDKTTIRQVFLRWANENTYGYPIGNNTSWPVGQPVATNDPSLLTFAANTLPFSSNNYYMAHMRQLTMMSLSMDDIDDPLVDPTLPAMTQGNTLRSYLKIATGAFLYQEYAFFENANTVAAQYHVPITTKNLGLGSGGLPVEGPFYGACLEFVQSALLALHTAGADDPTIWGPQVFFADSAYWTKNTDGYLHSKTPTSQTFVNWQGPVYLNANYGDTLRLYVDDNQTQVFVLRAIYDQMKGNNPALARDRWIISNTTEGGPAKLYQHASNALAGQGSASRTIGYFMAFAPKVQPVKDPDPRPLLTTKFEDSGLGRLLSRTDWTPNATWFDFKCSWAAVDHQYGDCGMFELYRQGEWLTKTAASYSNIIGISSEYNALTLQNDPAANPAPYEPDASIGGQFTYNSAGAPTVFTSTGNGYAFAQADATNLYNRIVDPWLPPGTLDAHDITHASRSIVWLKPDHIVIYDRATSKTANRFKHFNLNLITNPSVLNKNAIETLVTGQQLFIQNLLPINSILTAQPFTTVNNIAALEPTKFQLIIEDPSNPQDVRFLNILQGADADSIMDPATLLQSTGGTPYQGTLVRNTAVLFPVKLNSIFNKLNYTVPNTTTAHFITGLTPGKGYKVAIQSAVPNFKVTITAGGSLKADSAGVIVVTDANNIAPIGLTPQAITVDASGGAGSVSVSTLGKTPWSAISNRSWIKLISNSGAGDGQIKYKIALNNSPNARSGTINVAGELLTINQTGLQCTINLSPTSLSFINTGGVANVKVIAQTGCSWNAISNAAWVSISSGSSGNGNGNVILNILANTTGNDRNTTLNIADQSVNIIQSGTANPPGDCTYSLSIARKLMIAGASSKSVVVTTTNGCSWTASSDATWLNPTPTTGNGLASVQFAATANASTAIRTATLNISNQTVQVTQAGNIGNGCIYSLGTETSLLIPTGATIDNSGGANNVSLVAPGGCSWTVMNDVNWLTLTNTSYTGNAKVPFTVLPNTTGIIRTGHLTLADQIYTIIQSP